MPPRKKKNSPKDSPNESPKDFPNDHPKEASKGSPKEASKGSSKDASKGSSKDGSKGSPKDAPKDKGGKKRSAPRRPKEGEINSGKPWSHEDCQKLILMREAGKTHKHIAKELGRSEQSSRLLTMYLFDVDCFVESWHGHRHSKNCIWRKDDVNDEDKAEAARFQAEEMRKGKIPLPKPKKRTEQRRAKKKATRKRRLRERATASIDSDEESISNDDSDITMSDRSASADPSDMDDMDLPADPPVAPLANGASFPDEPRAEPPLPGVSAGFDYFAPIGPPSPVYHPPSPITSTHPLYPSAATTRVEAPIEYADYRAARTTETDVASTLAALRYSPITRGSQDGSTFRHYRTDYPQGSQPAPAAAPRQYSVTVSELLHGDPFYADTYERQHRTSYEPQYPPNYAPGRFQYPLDERLFRPPQAEEPRVQTQATHHRGSSSTSLARYSSSNNGVNTPPTPLSDLRLRSFDQHSRDALFDECFRQSASIIQSEQPSSASSGRSLPRLMAPAPAADNPRRQRVRNWVVDGVEQMNDWIFHDVHGQELKRYNAIDGR